jgi:hypothetical protein
MSHGAWTFYLFVVVFAILGLEFRAFTLIHSTSPIFGFFFFFFEIGSHKPFAWAGLKPQSS